MSFLTRSVRISIALTILSVLGWLGGCSENPVDPVDPPTPDSLIVSDEVTTAGLAASASAAVTLQSTDAEGVAYVSLPPGARPTGRSASIRRVGDTASIITAVFNGGFDPVPVNAIAGDSIDVIVRDAARGTVLQQRFAVAPRRPPVVVRTNPPRKKADVPLNSAIVLVFSEPIAGTSLTPSSVRLLRGSSSVAGTVRLLAGSGTMVAFVPSAPLDRNTAYNVEVRGTVRDLDGDALGTDVTVPFTTGQSSTGPAASITVAPDTAFMTGATYQMTATVRDASGNLLIDQPITWSTDDPAGLTVSPTGLLTALAAGPYHVTATVNGLLAEVLVLVSGGPAASVAVTPAQSNVGAAGDTILLTATVRDAGGRLVFQPVTWNSSDAAVATAAAYSSGNARLAVATVTGVSPGSVTITAMSGTASGTAAVTVTPPLPVASVTVSPASATLVVQGTTQLSATVQDANGKVLAGRLVTWTSDNPPIATVDANGSVRGVGVGTAAVTATSEGVSDTVSIAVQLTVFAFTSNRDGDYEVYLMNGDGSVVVALTNNSVSDYVGDWSPDGQKIVLQSDRDGNYEIYVMNADGSVPTRLTNSPSFDFHPKWSPDGQKIAFASSDGTYAGIYVMNADGSAQTRLTNGPFYDSSPTWSPDGQKIAFASTRDGNYEIYVMNADGSAQTRLTNSPSRDVDPAWSPDGQKIAFCQDPGSTPDPGIYVMNADGSAQTRLTNDGCVPAWSPDGQKIAFQSYLFIAGVYDDEVYVMNADGTNRTRITTNPAEDILPRWRP